MQLVLLRRREAMSVHKGGGGTITVLWDCVAGRPIAVIDYCHCPLPSKVVFGRESRVKKSSCVQSWGTTIKVI